MNEDLMGLEQHESEWKVKLINDRIFIFRWTNPLIVSKVVVKFRCLVWLGM